MLVKTIERLGGKPVTPKSNDAYIAANNIGALKTEGDVLTLALKLERGATNAYLGLINPLADKELVSLVARTAADEATHVALLLNATGQGIGKALSEMFLGLGGNVVLVDHGRTVTQRLDPPPGRDVPGDCACDGSIIEVRREPLRYEPQFEQTPLVFAAPIRPDAPAVLLLEQDPRSALPAATLHDTIAQWQPRRDLIGSGGDDRHFVAETDDEGRAHLRFGDGIHGHPPENTAAIATYRCGGGPAGNIGREAITHLVLRSGTISGPNIRVRNPLPARGGTDPEPMAEARMFAPGMIRARRERAIIADDYAELAQRDAPLQGAAARLCWSGSWYEARVAIDPAQREDCPPALIAGITGALHRYRRIGHDVAVVEARIVPLRLALHVCVLPHFSRAQIKAALLDIFSTRLRANGTNGFFHPDNWRFGQDVALSAIVCAAMEVEGIETVRVKALQRLNDASDESALETGHLVLRPGEIVRLANDPNYPENGWLEFDLGGGQ